MLNKSLAKTIDGTMASMMVTKIVLDLSKCKSTPLDYALIGSAIVPGVSL